MQTGTKVIILRGLQNIYDELDKIAPYAISSRDIYDLIHEERNSIEKLMKKIIED